MSATVVLVHGSFHAGWCWEPVASELQLRAVPTVVVDLPGRGRHPGALGCLSESATHVEKTIAEIRGPVVVVGHSFGGMVVTEGVAATANVKRLVYLAAFVPQAGHSMLSAAPQMIDAPLTGCLEERDDRVYFDSQRAQEIFYGDCSPEATRWAAGRLGPEPRSIFEAQTTREAFAHHPTCYVLCERDNAVPPDVQEQHSKRCDEVVRWDSDHSPMLSQPDLVVDLLTDLCL